MSDSYNFRYADSDNKKTGLAIFFPGDFSGEYLLDEVRKSWNSNPIISEINIIVFNFDKRSLDDIYENDELNKNTLFTLCSKNKIVILRIDENGDFLKNDNKIPPDEKRALLVAAFNDIYKRRKGQIDAPPGTHFQKPSYKHTDGFIRSANLLVSFSEVAFLSISLFQHLKESIERVLIDTSSIAHLVDTAIIIKNKISNKNGFPIVDSFFSYSHSQEKGIEWGVRGKRLIIISASTSGHLIKELPKGVREEEVLTFVLCRSVAQSSNALFQTPEGEKPIKSYSEVDCPLCAKGEKVVRFAGEQFLQDPPPPTIEMLFQSDQTKSQLDFLKKYASNDKDVLRSNPNESSIQKQLYIDIKAILERGDDFSAFHKHFCKKIRSAVSLETSLIIHLDDNASKTMAYLVKDYAQSHNKCVDCFSKAKLQNTEIDIKIQTGNIVVVASAITSGRQLLQVSRLLRQYSNTASIIYLVGFSKLPDKERREQLKSNLEHGDHRLEIIEEIYVPRTMGSLKTYPEKAGEVIEEHREILKSPIFAKFSAFEDDSSTEHFLPHKQNGNCKVLKLRPKFAFLEKENLSQADVLWVIQLVLHNWRSKHLVSLYHILLLDPAVFSRFNDGIVQAAILRSAMPSELNYAINDDISQRATDIILPIIENHASDEGEAAGEFLLALATGHMKLKEINAQQVIALKNLEMPDHIHQLLEVYEKSL